MSEESDSGEFTARRKFVTGCFALGGAALLGRDVYLQVLRQPFFANYRILFLFVCEKPGMINVV